MGDERHEAMIDPFSEEPVCATCWRFVSGKQPHYTGFERPAFPCEVARLRERVAALEGALLAVGVPLINGVVCWCQESRDMRQGHGDACLQARATLAGPAPADGGQG